eukprot:m.342679 g.342679  ORF g.342679 m.342679 type:complete len:552 (-) comp21706_c0_seq1:1-1656(-)
MFSLIIIICSSICLTQEQQRRNVLMITIDDLRPQLNYAYDMNQTQTPNLDAFAKGATIFHRAYCQMAVCSPSRNSFMTGRRPDTTKVWNFIDHFREPGVGNSWISLPQWFKQNGYLTYSSGKQFHPSKPPNNDFPTSWTEDNYNQYYWGNGNPIGDAEECCNKSAVAPVPFAAEYQSCATCVDLNDTAAMNNHDQKNVPQTEQEVEYDHRLATRTIESLNRVKQMKKNFFIGVGFRRPHLAWRIPRKFWTMYENKTIDVAKHETIGANITVLAYETNSLNRFTTSNGTDYHESPHGPAYPQDLQRGLRRGYYSAVSFMDFEVGRILDTLEELDLHDNTAVLFHSDHGWKLGEHGDWSKCTNWELDTRVPLLIRAPWIPQSLGARTMAFAELIDMFPTLVELAGLPPVPASEKLEGVSLVPVLQNPQGNHSKTAAFSQYPRCPEYNMYTDGRDWECLMIAKQNITRMGFSVRTEIARYTEWRIWKPTCEADWSDDGLVAQELYNHVGDEGRSPATFDDFEFENLAYMPSSQPLLKELAALLEGMYKHDLPGC